MSDRFDEFSRSLAEKSVTRRQLAAGPRDARHCSSVEARMPCRDVRTRFHQKKSLGRWREKIWAHRK
jgi:hypothetical protein